MKLINLSNISLIKKIITNLIIFLFTIFFLISFFILPTIKDIKHVGNEIETQRTNLEKKYAKVQNLKQLAKNLNKIEPELDKLDQIFINKDDELGFITNLEKIATTNNINQKINLGGNQLIENKIYKKIPLQISTNGSFSDQLNYLINLESLNYYINIKSLEISQEKNNIKNNTEKLPQTNLNFLITADTYWQ